jgi:SAM-dependent methyltransferase
MSATHRDRVRAEGFGEHAATYDRTRPSYPTKLVRWLSHDGIGCAVDVGCGTGRVAALLSDSGWRVIGVEPDPRMADIARSHGIDVAVASFEQWVAPLRDFDLVCSGTAWHWVDPTVGYDRAAQLLRPGGRLAIFRNSYTYEPAVGDGIRDAVRRVAPELASGCIPLGAARHDLVEVHAGEIATRTDLFVDLDRRVFAHDRTITAREWTDELRTHSPIARLDAQTRDELMGELEQLVHTTDSSRVRIHHATHCVVATRRVGRSSPSGIREIRPPERQACPMQVDNVVYDPLEWSTHASGRRRG